ncbi:hypothetical protein WJX74_004252 [Apatococcus lobatus]|uniref:Uncharacterized protein n=1 Tax=Apatococcus lobatus TaxID=904363 RepID=A0AAW1RPX6_9CHLO
MQTVHPRLCLPERLFEASAEAAVLDEARHLVVPAGKTGGQESAAVAGEDAAHRTPGAGLPQDHGAEAAIVQGQGEGTGVIPEAAPETGADLTEMTIGETEETMAVQREGLDLGVQPRALAACPEEGVEVGDPARSGVPVIGPAAAVRPTTLPAVAGASLAVLTSRQARLRPW